MRPQDTEFPGVVARPIGQFTGNADYHYQTLRCNCDLLKIIQLVRRHLLLSHSPQGPGCAPRALFLPSCTPAGPPPLTPVCCRFSPRRRV